MPPIDSWQAAEANAVEWMRAHGFPDAALTRGGADEGIDIRADQALAQVKWEASQVGRPELQRLVGARATDTHKTLLFFTGTGYASTAVDYAATMGIALLKYDLTGAVTAVNDHARALLEVGQPGGDRARRDGRGHLRSDTTAAVDFPVADALAWARAAQQHRRAMKAASAGPFRKHWPLAFTAYFAGQGALIAFWLLTGDPHGHVPADLGIAAIMIPLWSGVWVLRRRRRARLAPHGEPAAPDPGPLPAHVRSSVGQIVHPSAALDSTTQKVLAARLRGAVPALDAASAAHIIREACSE